MAGIEYQLEALAAALPEKSRRGKDTVREVGLVRYDDGTWRAMAGGHPSVSIGEWGGDFTHDAESAEDAIAGCLLRIQNSQM